jgi:L-asparagine transporter-like permease
MPGGLRSIPGSMLIVIFSYAGFEIIGLAASEAENPNKTIPRAITYTVISLVGLYIISTLVLLPLIPTAELSEEVSPMVAALSRWGMGWVSMVINFILVTAILSTMMASMFGLGRMMRSVAEEGHAPKWLKDKKDVPHKAIVFSGISMLLGLGFGLLFPRIYLFLISASGFALLFTYAVIMATHIRFRKRCGCPPHGKCQMPGYPYMSWIGLISMIIIILSMPLISGQASGLIVGFAMIIIFSLIYAVMKAFNNSEKNNSRHHIRVNRKVYVSKLATEFSKELTHSPREDEKNKCSKKECDCNKK